MDTVETPGERFEGLPGFDVEFALADVPDTEGSTLRMAFVDRAPLRSAAEGTVLLLHGQPTWSYLYRKSIDVLVARDRAIAPDLIGFGRSDKPCERSSHTLCRHVNWVSELVEQLDLTDVTLVVQDWGGPIGLGALASMPERFSRVVATNTILHTSDERWADRLAWANHGISGGRVVLQEALLDYMFMVLRAPVLQPSTFVRFATHTDVQDDVLQAYDAPFPGEVFMAGVRQFPALMPLTRNDAGAAVNRATWEVLHRWERPFLTAFSDGDPASRGWEGIFHNEVPGASGLDHPTIRDAGHFVQEDRGEELGRIIADLIDRTP